jgi:hypothetical protein
MSSIQETIAAKQRAMIPSRLMKGAGVLGNLWRQGIRCRSDWSGVCPCEPKSLFCEKKALWLSLVREYNGDIYPAGLSGNEAFLVLECMTEEMLTASGLTIVKEVPGARSPIRFGRNGTCLQTLLDLQALEGTTVYQEALDAVVKIQEVFGVR